MDDSTKFILERIENLAKVVTEGFTNIDRRFQKLEDNHEKTASIQAKHEERFNHHRELIDSNKKDLDAYSETRVAVDRDQYEKLNQLRSQIEVAITNFTKALADKSEAQSEKTGNLFFKWIPLIATILAVVTAVVGFGKK